MSDASFASPDPDLSWQEYVVELDRRLQATADYTPKVRSAIKKAFPTYSDFERNLIEVYRVIARGFLDDYDYSTYELFLEHHNLKKPPSVAVTARTKSAPWQKRVLRTVRELEKAYPDEVARKKEAAEAELKLEIEARAASAAKSKSSQSAAERELAAYRAKYGDIVTEPEPEPVTSGEVTPVKVEPKSARKARVVVLDEEDDGEFADANELPMDKLDLDADQDPIGLEDVGGPGTPLVSSDDEEEEETEEEQEESGEESDEEDEVPVVEATAPLIARFTLLTKTKKTRKPTLCQVHTARRSVQPGLESGGMRFVPAEEAEAFVSVPSKGNRGRAFQELVACEKSFFLLVDVHFLCRPEFIAACSATDSPFKSQFEYVPAGSYLTIKGEDGKVKEKITVPDSVWICHTASSKPKTKPAVFTPVPSDEQSLSSTMPDTTTVL